MSAAPVTVEEQLARVGAAGITEVTRFDVAIEDDWVYEELVRRFARMAGIGIDEDAVRLVPGCGPEAEIAYPSSDGTRRWHVALGTGRLDMRVLIEVAADFERQSGLSFASWETGSEVVLVCASKEALESLTELPPPEGFHLWSADSTGD
jgi:hypothetical protein